MTDKEIKKLGKCIATELSEYKLTDEELSKIADRVANTLISKALESQVSEWEVENSIDHLVGELARCMTLQNAYLEREEFEKCALMKIRIQEIKQKLGMPPDDIPDENDEI
jgi:protein-arginine kinase activator protein McsA